MNVLYEEGEQWARQGDTKGGSGVEDWKSRRPGGFCIGEPAEFSQ